MRLDEFSGAPKLRTLYVKRPLLNGEQFRAWAKSQGFTSTLPAADLHVTIAYSKEPVDWRKVKPHEDKLVVEGGERRIEVLGKDAITLVFAEPRLHARWAELIDDAGCSWDYPGYKPHVTISYEGKGIKPSKLDPYTGPLVFGPEILNEVDENWSDDVVEDPLTDVETRSLAEAMRAMLGSLRAPLGGNL